MDGEPRPIEGGADDDVWGEPLDIRRTVPHVARMWDYLLGGRANFAVDRRLVEQATAALPGGIDQARANARANREFLARAVGRLAGDFGVRQFLDIGCGLPADRNVHEVARAEDPRCRVVYVDHDLVVLSHARGLVRAGSHGEPALLDTDAPASRGVVGEATTYLDADVREPDDIINRAARTLDLHKPVGVMLLGVLDYLLDDERPDAIVARLVERVAPGSYLVVSHLASDVHPEATAEFVQRHNRGAPNDLMVARSRAEVARLLDGLELIRPGVAPVGQWLGPPPDDGRHSPIPIHGAIARQA